PEVEGVGGAVRVRRPVPRGARDGAAPVRPRDRDRPEGLQPLLVRRGRERPRLRRVARRPRLPSRRVSLASLDIARVRADNPSPLTLSGTNTWVVGRDPAWVIDPGPLLDPHLDAVTREVAARGGAGGIAITHTHADHVEGADALAARLGVSV